MNPDYYKAAEKGKIDIFKNIGKALNLILTPNRNTVLHVYLTALTNESELSPTNFVNEILKMCPSLLWQANTKGETPLHIASRYGHASNVQLLIEHAESLQEDVESGVNTMVKQMLEMPNKEKDTALHEAARNNHLAVVKLLIEKGPEFSYSANDIGETPLYIAVERNFKELVLEILQSCTSPAHGGPLGRTTLHAAVISDDEEGVAKFALNVEDESVWLEDIPSPVRAVAHANAHIDVE
ncbi:protein ACCELERATED CELL DEATH 6-like [Fagus crenata]